MLINSSPTFFNIDFTNSPGITNNSAQLQWNYGFSSYTLPFSDVIQITNTTAVSNVLMPTETNGVVGSLCIIHNSSSFDVNIQSSNGQGIQTLSTSFQNSSSSSNVYMFVLTNPSITSPAAWQAIPLGSGMSTRLASTLINNNSGLSIQNNQLSLNYPICYKSAMANINQSVNDQNNLIVITEVNTGQNVNYNLLPTATAGNGFIFSLQNSLDDTSMVTVVCSGTDLIDDNVSNMNIYPGQTVTFVCDGNSNYYTLNNNSISGFNTPMEIILTDSTPNPYSLSLQQSFCSVMLFNSGYSQAPPATQTINFPQGFAYFFIIENNTPVVLTIQTLATNGTPITVGANAITLAYCDGSNFYSYADLNLGSLNVSGNAVFNGPVYFNGTLTTTGTDISIGGSTGLNITSGNISVQNGTITTSGSTGGFYVYPSYGVTNDACITETISPAVTDCIKKKVYGASPIVQIQANPNVDNSPTQASFKLEMYKTVTPTDSSASIVQLLVDDENNIFPGIMNADFSITPYYWQLQYGGTGVTSLSELTSVILPSPASSSTIAQNIGSVIVFNTGNPPFQTTNFQFEVLTPPSSNGTYYLIQECTYPKGDPMAVKSLTGVRAYFAPDVNNSSDYVLEKDRKPQYKEIENNITIKEKDNTPKTTPPTSGYTPCLSIVGRYPTFTLAALASSSTNYSYPGLLFTAYDAQGNTNQVALTIDSSNNIQMATADISTTITYTAIPLPVLAGGTGVATTASNPTQFSNAVLMNAFNSATGNVGSKPSAYNVLAYPITQDLSLWGNNVGNNVQTWGLLGYEQWGYSSDEFNYNTKVRGAFASVPPGTKIDLASSTSTTNQYTMIFNTNYFTLYS